MSTVDLQPLAVRAAAPAELPPLPADAGLTWRPLTPDDVPAWFALCEVVENHDNATERSAESELADRFKGGWREPARDGIAGFDADGNVRAYAWSEFRPVAEGTQAPTLFGAVHPEYRRRGIGRALLAWSEARARQQLAAAPANLPARIRFYVDEAHAEARRLAEAAGFTPIRWYVVMRRDLAAELPAGTVPEGLRIEPYSKDRDEDTRVAHNESFARDHWGSSPIDAEAWALNVVGGEKFRPDWSFTAVDEATGRVAGYLMSGAYDQDWEPQGYTEGWTDLVSVRREHRGRGLAGALLTAAMRVYLAGGMQYAGLDVETDNPTGALGVYTRLGYERMQSSVLLSKEI
ncbi:GNAT family N-acetyltransferase [Jiangella endophytica]|uniref:GNAT family N-acetyltransferase n=1 Tax=Jiangella endophytica TaxID=1623398 RepID=UPI000E340752|nr:GNAT family N-acetyltransferase [Jiangella endophytica]